MTSIAIASPPPIMIAETFLRPVLIDRDRTSKILRKAGLDALVLTEPENVYYATGIWPPLEPMGLRESSIAIVPGNAADPIAYITYQFIYYYAVADGPPAEDVEPYLVTGSDGEGAAPPMLYALCKGAGATARERNRRERIEAIPCFHASIADAATRALRSRGLLSGRLGFDSLAGSDLLSHCAESASPRDARNIVKHIRLVKTPNEISLMCKASAANVEAALATAKQMRALGSIRSVRREFFRQVSELGNTPRFMAVDGVINVDTDGELREGTSVLIDCVSHYVGYHGDFGRTVFIDEPPKRVREAVAAISTTIEELGPLLRPGLKFSGISALGQGILSKFGDYAVPFGPHAVGLAHTDQPMADLDGGPVDLTLEAGMIISVDCPLLEAGEGGTVHMEDLVLITPEGAVAIHDTGTRHLMV